MKKKTKKWLFLKFSSSLLIPLMIWFIINFISIYDSEYPEIINFFSSYESKALFALFLIFAFFFSTLTITEIFEDYIHDEKIKNAANKFVYIFAIIMPLITIIGIFNLTL